MANSDSDSGIVSDRSNVALIEYQSYVVVCRACKHVLFMNNDYIVRHADWTGYNINVSIEMTRNDYSQL